MVLEGGLRDRMLFDSVMNAVVNHLATQGWFDATVYDGGSRQHRPLTVTDEFPDPEGTSEVALNTLAFSWNDGVGVDIEMGSKQEEHFTAMFVDFFAENDGVGRHVIGDVYAFLKKNRAIPVYDYRQATPTIEFYVTVDQSVEKRKPDRATNPWMKHWYVCAFTLADERANA